MAFRSLPTPVVAACLMGVLMGIMWLSKPAPRSRLSKADKKDAKRLARKRGRGETTKRARSKRKETRARLVQAMGVDEFKKLVHKDRQEKDEQKERLRAAMDDPDSLRLVVDLDWAESAPGKELSSLVKQLCYVYNRVKSSLAPPKLTMTSFRGRAAVSLSNCTHNSISAYHPSLQAAANLYMYENPAEDWTAGAGSWLVEKIPLGVFSVFDPAQVVYLSPDAEEPLEEVLATNVYVIGGIVDRTLSKGLSLAAAEAGGARAVRLPFDEYLQEVPRNDRVLTVCACAGVLMAVHAGGDWREALEKSVPKRGVEYAARRARGGGWRGVGPSEGPGWGLSKVQVRPKDGSGSGGLHSNDGCVGVVADRDICMGAELPPPPVVGDSSTPAELAINRTEASRMN